MKEGAKGRVGGGGGYGKKMSDTGRVSGWVLMFYQTSTRTSFSLLSGLQLATFFLVCFEDKSRELFVRMYCKHTYLPVIGASERKLRLQELR